jgi:hypothetical protein
VGAGQADCARFGVADDGRIAQAEHAAGESVGVQGWLAGVFEVASGQGEGCQVGIKGEEAFFEEAIFKLKADLRAEILQV